MSFSCAHCDFTSNFESALMMHYQLHHEAAGDQPHSTRAKSPETKAQTTKDQELLGRRDSKVKLPGRTSSATKLFQTIRSKICKSRLNMFVHPEESSVNVHNDLCVPSECTSKALKADYLPNFSEGKESYVCHLCPFEAERITTLDRHLLNDHQIGLENLLKLVMAKTRDGLTEDSNDNTATLYRKPYYATQDVILEDEEFVIETVRPKIQILKNCATNTDLHYQDIPECTGNCQNLSRELEEMIECSRDKCNNKELLAKMQALNKYMCKFASSSNTLKRVLNKQFDTKNISDHVSNVEEPTFDLGLGDVSVCGSDGRILDLQPRSRSEPMYATQSSYNSHTASQSPRDWEKAFSEKMERCRRSRRGDKNKLETESFYF